jgi:hypothetical protein
MFWRNLAVLTMQPFPDMRLLHSTVIAARFMPLANPGGQNNLAADNFQHFMQWS